MNKIGQIASPMESLKDDATPSMGPSSGGYTGGQCAGYPAASGATPIQQMAEQQYDDSASKIVTPLDGDTSIGATGSSAKPMKGSSGIATPMSTPWGNS